MQRADSLRLPTFCTCLVLATGQIHAQDGVLGGAWETTMRFEGRQTNDQLGFNIASAGDLDGDLVPDILLGADFASPLGLNHAGRIMAVSGVDGATLFEVNGPNAGERFGHWIAGGHDLDGDAVPDFVVGAPFASPNGRPFSGAGYVYSGANANLLYHYEGDAFNDQLAHSVAMCGDLDGDGRSEFLIGVPWQSAPDRLGAARIYSGATGQLLRSFTGPRSQSAFGYTLDNAGDVNADGVPDQIISASGFTPKLGLTLSDVFVYSGEDGSLLHDFHDPEIGDVFGWSVAGAGDIDQDGYDDVIVGARGVDNGWRDQAGAAYVFSGQDGTMIYRFKGRTPGERLGRNVSRAGDVNGDGVPDLLVTSDEATPGGLPYAGWAFLYSGADGRELWRFDGAAAHARLGHFTAGLGDLDGDGLDEFAISAPYANVEGKSAAGVVYVKAYNEVLRTSSDQISAAQGQNLTFLVDFPESEAGNAFRILLSSTGTGPTFVDGVLVPLTRDGLFFKSFHNNLPPFFGGTGDGTLDLDGDAVAHAVLPPGQATAWIGMTFHAAAVSYVPGFNVRGSSVAVSVTIVP